ncbi:unnamed protein product [Triticum turgidum subsp. durum]|uniref:Uncharacterized protein n=1 Tax=Triticum turgidum subsp. durum TaxID=4567 RepID=A0A9R0ZZP4_TRITD|nr:unnamed protein product [Triticum turgidum subsp. durum]
MGRSPCCEKAHTNKGAWTREEDERLVAHSCRLRWINYLRPDLKRGNFSRDEDELIVKLHSLLGNKWSLIAARLPGRTDNEIKNYWNTHIRRKLLGRGIDPVTHRPLTDATTVSFVHPAEAPKTQPVTEERKPPRCPDLNLDLCISLPFQQEEERPPARACAKPVKMEQLQQGRLCFRCSILRVRGAATECSCGSNFLGLRAGMLDFRGLEMK